MKDLRNASRVGHLQFLSEENKRDIYLTVLEILGKVGMQVHHDEARAMLLAAGCTLTPEDRVLMPAAPRRGGPSLCSARGRRLRPRRRGRHGARWLQQLLRHRVGPHVHLRPRHRRTPAERPRGRAPRRPARRCAAQPGLRHELGPSHRQEPPSLLSSELPGDDGEHHQAAGHDRRERRRPRGDDRHRPRAPRRGRGVAPEALLRGVQRTDQPPRASRGQPGQAAVVRRHGRALDLLPGAARRRHGAHHGGGPHRPRGRRIACSAS